MKFFLEKPETPVDLLVIAGEHSGDEQASRIVAKMLKKNDASHIYAIGGVKLKEAGAKLLFDLTKFSVVGLLEVAKHILVFKKLLHLTVAWIKEYRPKVLCLVDYPGFNLRLAKELYRKKLSNKAGGSTFIYYYISPQIWAWKARRRFIIAKLIDSLGVIFPFEANCYNDTDLDVNFVGHPFLEDEYNLGIEFSPSAPMLLLPGSRATAIKRIFPVMLQLFRSATAQNKKAIVLYPNETLRQILYECTVNHRLESRIDFIPVGTNVLASSALMSSGTMSLKCALAGLPSLIIYKANPITFLLGRRLVKVKYLGMANILLNEEAIPEFIQTNFQKAIPYISQFHSPKMIECAKNNSVRIKNILSAKSGHPDSSPENLIMKKIFSNTGSNNRERST
ncbi:MAG: lipid-A-disaccharide synthase [Puniceicoccales bacterium]|jgi:lipid-A-disaccharide synthase|nr:lipid-A-disaccharide synthase [Puniceicoccales bacterium]